MKSVVICLLFNVNELLISLSQTLDFAEKEFLRNNKNHGMRVAYVSARIAKSLTLTDEKLFDLISYSLLHDNGVMGSLHKENLQGGKAEFAIEADPTHCVEGEKKY